ncbi:uncharacterized protein SCHCODRAFT_02135061 [Schizophyllum commune H4-8]|uniref:uncharacterized protein n=1 Tax=Schizophyllum commune (strain H4-8 / FGSC 9210) TaxID=578458 RepID=UPI00215F50BD|nr:uncharacterized protein SCHCODRAFT_02135061 [Schizophyllum commune H4-8]KAI5884808.1 hypothetical protein SCHCODRAFT_02135061 [Schizophyllum commune H4-8]
MGTTSGGETRRTRTSIHNTSPKPPIPPPTTTPSLNPPPHHHHPCLRSPCPTPKKPNPHSPNALLTFASAARISSTVSHTRTRRMEMREKRPGWGSLVSVVTQGR